MSSSNVADSNNNISLVSSDEKLSPQNTNIRSYGSVGTSKALTPSVRSQIVQIYDNAMLDDVTTLTSEKKWMEKTSFFFSLMGKLLVALATIFSGLQLHYPNNSYFGNVTLICNISGSTCLALDHYFSKECASKISKLETLAEKLHLETVVVDTTDAPQEENKD